MIRVLLIEDSRPFITLVEGLLRAEPDMEALPAAEDRHAGVEAARRHRPDVILVALELPGAIEVIEEIMASAPCPIVTLGAPAGGESHRSLQAGAVDVLPKPSGLGERAFEAFGASLVGTVRLMRNARVVRRYRGSPAFPAPLQADAPQRARRIILLGASTGGPAVLMRLLSGLPAPYALPIAIAQHTIHGFEHSLAQWLSRTGHVVRLVERVTPIRAGEVALAPANRHLVVSGGRYALVEPVGRVPVPSVDVLFESAVTAFGSAAVAVLLTGMGADGARGLLSLHRAGALTITQQGDTCVIDGMPAIARRTGASQHDLGPDQITQLLRQLAPRVR